MEYFWGSTPLLSTKHPMCRMWHLRAARGKLEAKSGMLSAQVFDNRIGLFRESGRSVGSGRWAPVWVVGVMVTFRFPSPTLGVRSSHDPPRYPTVSSTHAKFVNRGFESHLGL
jgi:hypothetical protein